MEKKKKGKQNEKDPKKLKKVTSYNRGGGPFKRPTSRNLPLEVRFEIIP